MTENEDGEFEKLPYNPADFGLELIFSKIPQEDNRQERVGPALSPVRAALDKESLGLTTDSVKVEITDPVERKKQRFKHLQFLFFRWVHKLMVDSGQKMSFLENVKRAMVEFSRFNEKYSGWMPNAILLDLYDDSRAIAEVDNIDGDKLVANSSGSLEPMTKTDFASFWYEVKVLMERTSVLSGRSFAQGPLKLTECLFISFLAGITWLQTNLGRRRAQHCRLCFLRGRILVLLFSVQRSARVLARARCGLQGLRVWQPLPGLLLHCTLVRHSACQNVVPCSVHFCRLFHGHSRCVQVHRSSWSNLCVDADRDCR